jgi:DNA polymerase elongation subunit (family B)
MVLIQPCDWIESDSNFKYVVDIFGRTSDNEVAKVRLTGFRPYFYLRSEEGETSSMIQALLEKHSEKRLFGLKITQELKLDAMKGFNGLVPIKVWKFSCSSLWMFKLIAKTLKDKFKIQERRVSIEDIYESNLPPYIRVFHELHICPASPIEFDSEDFDPPEDENVDVYFVVNYDEIAPSVKPSIPLYACAYDIETYSSTGNFPMASNYEDEIMQIGVSFRYTNNLLNSVKRYVFVNKECSESTENSLKFISCKSEKDLLVKFHNCIMVENPDIIAGYNTFGFDDAYIADRAILNKVSLDFGRVPANAWKNSEYVKTEKKTFELASGKFAVRYILMPGRLTIDLLLSVRREQNLDSYKLDNVATTFLRDKVTNVVTISGTRDFRYEIHTKSTRGLFNGNLVSFDIVTNTSNPYRDVHKFIVCSVQEKSFTIISDVPVLDELTKDEFSKLEWSFGKDDVSVTEMFKSHKGTSVERAKIAKYCIQDCDLVLTLMAKLDTFVNACGMADVCKVPIQYIFLRGQGIKIYSAIVYNASRRNQIIMTQENVDGDTSYEGAIVLPPKIGMYLDQPIPVLDFNSLYPSNMIAFNLSPDTLVYVKTFNSQGKKIKQEGPNGEEFIKAGYKIDEISYDVKDPEGRVTCGFVQPNEDNRTIGVIPQTLDILLKKRKETRKLMESCPDESQKSVLNGLQLAYKTVANSVYGQAGSRTSPIRKIEVAACTTAAGRDRIQFAKSIVENEFGGEVIYGDTDSIFIKFPTKDLAESIELGKKSAEKITSLCRKPYKIEYEKTFFPFVLFCRKRYVGMMYEDDVKKCKRKTMGIALKRRDNAPIVKDIYGGALDILMETRDIKNCQQYVKDMLVKVIQNKIPLDKFIITKQLRDDYKNPEQIAHRVLADRMEERDAGNKPQVGDRLSFVFVAGREGKQGERIDHIDYVREKGLKPDAEFYITNQIQNPVAQLFALAIEEVEGYSKKSYPTFSELDEEEATLKVLKLKEKDLDSLMFMGAQYLKKHKKGPLDNYFQRPSK